MDVTKKLVFFQSETFTHSFLEAYGEPFWTLENETTLNTENFKENRQMCEVLQKGLEFPS